ncbi:MAG: hypothetical protein C4547_02595 [Phycisphaerales bacterium]|nr:MAG: hypothetical protein C4547_02595 [Phycisphaerales bacterium]
MSGKLDSKDRRTFEIMLIVVTVGMTLLLFRLGGYRMVTLHLYFLPIVLAGYYLGRTNAGILALFSALAVSAVVASDPASFMAFKSPMVVGLALTVWASALGLTALLVGTLCDERAATVRELEVAYVGVIEVLSRYLQSANPKVKARSVRVAELSQRVAQQMRMTQKEVDDVRVGALLYDLGSVEVTTTLISKAVSSVGGKMKGHKHTFMGTDLVQSLGTVLHGALPLVLNQDEAAREVLTLDDGMQPADIPLGARIIRAVRAYETLLEDGCGGQPLTPVAALRELRGDALGGYDVDVLDVIERCVDRPGPRAVPAAEPAFV